MKGVIWDYSIDNDNIIFIFRTLPHKEIKIDLRERNNLFNLDGIRLTIEEQNLVNSLIIDVNQHKTCKSCKYLLKTQPNKRIMHKCAVTGKDVTLAMKACQEFKNDKI